MGATGDDDILAVLADRFRANPHRHPDVGWDEAAARLSADPAALATVREMERTGGMPDVIGREGERIVVCDCAPESPAGRRSLCYDQAALDARRQNKPAGSAVAAAAALGVDLLTEPQYRDLQALEPFDLRTSSWIATPPAVRALGGALFCDRRYDRVFVYHNGAESYYAARGFRGRILV